MGEVERRGRDFPAFSYCFMVSGIPPNVAKFLERILPQAYAAGEPDLKDITERERFELSGQLTPTSCLAGNCIQPLCHLSKNFFKFLDLEFLLLRNGSLESLEFFDAYLMAYL